ncbi:MAG TPA: hypothetical protein VFJ20_10930, partial [Gemmatimonadaceae bacterium]|nr:hypothetical protein [Gemmatimonadaceae bacterium]
RGRGQGGAGGGNESSTAGRERAARMAMRCDAADAPLVVDSIGIGPVIRGARIAELGSRCSVSDTTIVLGEGTPERAHAVNVRGHRVAALSTGTPDTSIIRVITTDRAFRTSGGVGVGSSVESLRLAHGRICAARGETDFVVTAADLPGVSFAIDWNPPSRDPSAAETPFPGGDPGVALDAARITKLWVHGVSGACRVGVG